MIATGNGTIFLFCFHGKNHYPALSGLALQRVFVAFRIYVLLPAKFRHRNTKPEKSGPLPSRNRKATNVNSITVYKGFRLSFHLENSYS